MSDGTKRPPPKPRGGEATRRPPPKRRANPLLAGPVETETPSIRGRAQDEAHLERTRERDAPHGPQEPEPHARAVCTVGLCPICTFVTALDDVRPELAEHLLQAGREVLLAVRALIDARLEAAASNDRTAGGPDGAPGHGGEAGPDDTAPPQPRATKAGRRRGGIPRSSPLEKIVIG